MTKYNLLMRNENEGILESIVDGANGKLIIASDNSFVISSILEELKNAAWAGGFELYNGSSKVNPDITSDVVIVAVCTQMTYSMPMITPQFSVATLTRDSKDSFIFTIDVKPVVLSDEFAGSLQGKVSDEVSHKSSNSKEDDEAEIYNSLRAHNVVFVQDLNDSVIDKVRHDREDVRVIHYLNTICDGYTLTADDGIIVLKIDAPDSMTLEHADCISFMSEALKYGVKVLCNTTWVKFFLELTSTEDDISLSSVVIYNTNVFGLMGNSELYTPKN